MAKLRQCCSNPFGWHSTKCAHRSVKMHTRGLIDPLGYVVCWRNSTAINRHRGCDVCLLYPLTSRLHQQGTLRSTHLGMHTAEGSTEDADRDGKCMEMLYSNKRLAILSGTWTFRPNPLSSTRLISAWEACFYLLDPALKLWKKYTKQWGAIFPMHLGHALSEAYERKKNMSETFISGDPARLLPVAR